MQNLASPVKLGGHSLVKDGDRRSVANTPLLWFLLRQHLDSGFRSVSLAKKYTEKT
jgi:hypothetical protein